jgi:filamentous hemagglutinin family protein
MMSKCTTALIQICLIATIGGILARSEVAIAQLVSASSGNNTNTLVISDSNGWKINGGSQQASSLFHNFSHFNIPVGKLVKFEISPGQVDRIVAHIQNAANIQGTIRIVDGLLTTTTADLFLLSHNGILFGRDASVDIKGAFFATTANEISFNNNVVFRDGILNVGSATGTPEHQPNQFSFSSTATAVNINGLRLGPELTSLSILGNSIAINNSRVDATMDGLHMGAVEPNRRVGISQSNTPGSIFSFTYPSNINSLGLIAISNSILEDRDYLGSALT